MRVVEDIGNAVMRAKGALHRMHTMPQSPGNASNEAFVEPLNLSRAVVDAMLRVEVTLGVAYELDRYSHNYTIGWCRDTERKLCGVSVYQVEHALPSCGWRPLNPIGVTSILLGLPVPEYGVGGIAR